MWRIIDAVGKDSTAGPPRDKRWHSLRDHRLQRSQRSCHRGPPDQTCAQPIQVALRPRVDWISASASGAITRRRSPVVSRLPIFSSATFPAPTKSPSRPSSFKKTGSKLMATSVRNRVGHAASGQIALNRRKGFSRQITPQLVIAVAREPCTQIFFTIAGYKIVAEQSRNRLRHQHRRASDTQPAAQCPRAVQRIHQDRSNKRLPVCRRA